MTHPFPPDDEIISLFRDWIVAQHEADALGERGPADGTPEKAEFDAACDRIAELVQTIADTASLGPIGLAIKVYLRHHSEHGVGYCGGPETLSKFYTDGPYDDLELSMVEDAARFCPELAPLAAGAFEPAEKEAA